MDINSASTFVNEFNLISIVSIVIWIHFIVVLFLKALNKSSTTGRFSFIAKVLKWITIKIYYFLTFGYYIRIILQTSQNILISSIIEAKSFDSDSASSIISLIFAWFMLGAITLLFSISLFFAFTSYWNVKETEHSNVGELFAGIKQSRRSKFYTVYLLSRRILYIWLLILFSSLSIPIKIGIMSIIQLSFMLFLMIIRPFIEAKDNIIEIMNEMFFWFFLNWLFIFDSLDKWNSSATSAYISVILWNNLIVSFIVSGNQIYLIIIAVSIKSYWKLIREKCFKRSNTSVVHATNDIDLQNIRHEEIIKRQTAVN